MGETWVDFLVEVRQSLPLAIPNSYIHDNHSRHCGSNDRTICASVSNPESASVNWLLWHGACRH
jgi:hypothetical protein